MTTELSCEFVEDVFVEGVGYSLSRTDANRGLHLAAMLWVCPAESVRAGHRIALAKAVASIGVHLPDHRRWLLVSQAAWQPDTRIARHRGIWGALRARGLSIPGGREVAAGIQVSGEGLRHFGAIELADVDIEATAGLLEAERFSYLVFVSGSTRPEVEGLVREGWGQPTFGPSSEVLKRVCNQGGLVLSLVGAFDDYQSGVVVLANPLVVRQLCETNSPRL